MTAQTSLEKAEQKSFTSDKLDWITALVGDHRMSPRAKCVGFCIVQHVNRQSGLARLSDDTISDKTGIPKRWVARARNDLREHGWIDWKRTKTANLYWPLTDQINRVLDDQVRRREIREDRRKLSRPAPQELPRVAYLESQVLPRVAIAELPQVAERELPQVANVHLKADTVVVTPLRKRTSGGGC